jgi:hypothetical protein
MFPSECEERRNFLLYLVIHEGLVKGQILSVSVSLPSFISHSLSTLLKFKLKRCVRNSLVIYSKEIGN